MICAWIAPWRSFRTGGAQRVREKFSCPGNPGTSELKGGKALGSIRWDGHELLALKEKEWRKLRGKVISFVPQSPMSALNPALRLGTQMQEAWKLHGRAAEITWKNLSFKLWRTLPAATEEFLCRYPSEISVGQAQRVLIGMALCTGRRC